MKKIMQFDIRKHKRDLLFIPLGGSGEIGMNLNLYHLDGKFLIVDMGLGFASDLPGINMIAPDISFLKENRKNILGIVATHIHEDHMGAIQYFWEELELPIYTSHFAANFLKAKLGEFEFCDKVNIIEKNSSDEFEIGPFKIELIGLTHSVPEMNAVLIKTSRANVLHSGDWKLDPDPIVGYVSDTKRIAEYGKKGKIDAMVCDSTNVFKSGHSGSEGDLEKSLSKIIGGCKNMVGVTTFASNIARVHTIAKAAQNAGRKVCLLGFSLRRVTEAAKRSGYLLDLDKFISDREIKRHDRSEILLICTGCQGEPLASTKKIASDKHPAVRMRPGDTMIFSSKIIPGNEKKIFEMFNQLALKDVEVITEKDHFVHVSGHPNQDELKEMYKIAKPKAAIPVHGENVHIREHARLARKWGAGCTVEPHNGSVIKIDKGGDAEIIGDVKSGYLAIDGKNLIPANGSVIQTRRKLQDGGIAIICVNIDKHGKVIGKPIVRCPGVCDLQQDKALKEIVEEDVVCAVDEAVYSFALPKKDNRRKGNREKKKKGKKKGGLLDIFSKEEKPQYNFNQPELQQHIRKYSAKIVKKIFKDETGKDILVEIIVNVV